MNAGIEQMLEAYDIRDLYDRKNAMKEIMQEIVLCGLSRANFFQEAAFYGGTALRIFYGLDRFSEDLDFSLKTEDDAFDLALYFPALEKEVRSFGLNLTRPPVIPPKIKRMLCERFDAIDFARARQEVEPFIRDRSSLNLWSTDFFKQITEKLRGR